MTRDDVVDLMLKAVGLLFLVLAVLAIPKVLTALLAHACWYGHVSSESAHGFDASRMFSLVTLRGDLTALLKFVLCIAGARHFLGNPKKIRQWMERGKTTEHP